MKKIQSGLYGENLRRFLNIQETIQRTRRAVSQGGLGSHLHEDILHFSRHRKHIDGAGSLASIPGDTGYSYDDASEKLREQGRQRKAEFGFGYRDGRDDLSEWMLDELKTTKRPEKKLSSASHDKIPPRASIGSLGVSDLETPEAENDDRDEIDMRLNDQITPEEEQKIYAKVCNRYGKESGRRYLLVRSLTAPEKKIEVWTTTERKHTESSRKDVECLKIEIKHEEGEICPLISEGVRKKMETLVEIIPACTTERLQEPKRWKDALRNPLKTSQKPLRVSIKAESEFSNSVSERPEYTPCHCNLYQCDCDLIKEKCSAPKVTKKCDMVNYLVDETNNYLITCRENLQDKKNNDRRVTVLQQHATKFANRDTRESVYLQSAHDQAANELMTCLMKVMPPQGQEVSQTGVAHVQQMTNVISEHKMIDDHEWRVWRYAHTKMEHKENSDELDSLDSDIASSSTGDEGCSECNIDYSKSVQPSRIPYFKETFQLANTLFDKIDAKMEKIISKNHDAKIMRMRKPHSFLLKEKIKLLRDDNSLFNQICKQFNSDNFYCKRLTPFTERKRRKRVRANEKKVELSRKQNQRKLIEGLQFGKKYRRPKRSFLYTEQENYRGFSQRRQKILQKTRTEKFRNCNLVAKDVTGRKLSKRIFHNDYRFIRRLFSDQLDRNQESLWDSGMKARLEQYLVAFREAKNITEHYGEEDEDKSELSLGTILNQKRPTKDEQKTQTALPSCWSYCSSSSGNAPEAFASMIRSLRSDGRSLADLNSTNRGNLSHCARILSATTFGHTGQCSSQPPDSQPTTGTLSSELGTRLSKLPSSKLDTPLKCRPYTKTSSFVKPDTNSIPHVSLRRQTPTGKTFANSTKTLPPLQQSMQKNLSDNNFWKLPRAVREPSD